MRPASTPSLPKVDPPSRGSAVYPFPGPLPGPNESSAAALRLPAENCSQAFLCTGADAIEAEEIWVVISSSSSSSWRPNVSSIVIRDEVGTTVRSPSMLSQYEGLPPDITMYLYLIALPRGTTTGFNVFQIGYCSGVVNN